MSTHHHAEPASAGFPLLQASAGQRFGIAIVLLAALWAAVAWAMA